MVQGSAPSVGAVAPLIRVEHLGKRFRIAERRHHVGRIGVVFGQRTQLWWDLPVTESFELLRDIYRVADADYRHTRDELVALLDIESLLDTPVRQLSLGQRMRCDLAASLLHQPPLLADEHAGCRIDQDGSRVTCSVRGDVAGFVAGVTGGYAIRDLMASRPPIEELVAALYASGPDRPALAEATGAKLRG